MNVSLKIHRSGFSLIETVIAIGVLAVLLSGFMIVFAPAAQGIRKSLNSQDANRMVATLEQELVTLRGTIQANEYATGFDKAFEYIKDSAAGSDYALLIYKYRADFKSNPRDDGTFEPLDNSGQAAGTEPSPGSDYVVQNMMRRMDDSAFLNEDLPLIDGQVYLVKCTQLVMNSSGVLSLGNEGEILKEDGSAATNNDLAVIPFVADFYALPVKSKPYFENNFRVDYDDPAKFTKPTFSRNLAVRR